MKTPALEIPLSGRALIEASAGTGKTWTLTGIILRLLIEGRREPREVIATTFTRKAAAEMQQRVQARLLALRENLQTIAARYVADETVLHDDGGLADRLSAILDEKGEGDHINRHLILNAVATRGLDGLIEIFSRVESLQERLDELFIGTIDSLCQRWLAEFALETGNDERLQINENSPALEEAIHDALRCLLHENYQTAPETFTRLLASGAFYDSDAYLAAAREAANYPDAYYPDAKIDDEPTASAYDRVQHQALLRQLRETPQSTIDDWRTFITSPEFTAATRKDAAWKSRIDLLPQLLQQLREQQQPDSESGKLADALQNLKTNKGKANEALGERYNAHPFTALLRDLIAEQQVHDKMLEQRARQTTAALLKVVSKEYPKALAARGETTFSEKTRRINAALAHPQHGTNLAHYLVRRYPVMLVDESQDLNDEQAALLERTYLRADTDRKHSFLLLVGDPKQAIYGFRGGDVANYNRLKTHFQPDEQHSLNINRRSSANLIAALNEHYRQGDNARFGEKITYHEAQAANPAPTIVSASGDTIAQPMQWLNSGKNNPDEIATIAALVAQLTAATSPYAHREPNQPLSRIRPDDIQILMRSNDSLAQLQEQLHQYHIDSERSHDRSVFTGAVARTFADLLAAIEQPDQRDRQNRLLSGLYYGYNQQDLDRLAAIEQGEKNARAGELTLADLREALAQAHDAWQTWGLLAAINPLLTHAKHNIWQTLAACPAPDNLRHLLDLRHIQTILAEHAPKQRPAQFSAWWRAQLAAPPDADWAKAPPLPGQNAVHLYTIHKAKGLESPITILATGGSRSGGNANPVKTWRYRSGDTVHISLNKPAGNESEEQENEEQRRLLYVGLTRAKNLLFVAHREFKPDKPTPTPTEKLYLTYTQNPDNCPHAGETSTESPPPPVGEGRGGAHSASPLPLWGRGLGGAHSASPLPPWGRGRGGGSPANLVAESPANPPLLQSGGGSASVAPAPTWRTHYHGWQRSSFSALLRDAVEQTPPDLADYAIAEPQTLPDAPADADIRYTYPRGTAPGSALHAVLERIHPDNRADWRRYLEHENRQWQLGLEPAQLDACETWLEAIHASVLPQSRISLGASKQGIHRSEYSFTLGSDDRAPLAIKKINELLTAAGHPLHLSDKHRHIRYLRGEIDHIYQHDGRYYILDYKTNHLGNRPADYTPEKIREAMNDHHYWLQAALYQVALHRLLQKRLPDYDPARHLGGIEYHYLRGIDPAEPENGKYGWNYPPEFIAALDRILSNNPL